MCIFSTSVPYVANTRIFARSSAPGRQYLAYQMNYQVSDPVAMILPLSLRQRASEGSVRFINLKSYPDFFSDLLWATGGGGGPMGGGFGGGGLGGGKTLRVVEVGDFIASVVPTLGDFRRIDPRFTLSPKTWAKIPEYNDYGFAVFQLATTADDPKTIAPIAFEFETRLPSDQIFFPTVHVHDNWVHPKERFDHALYYQKLPGKSGAQQAQRSARSDRNGGSGMPDHVNLARAQGLVSGETLLYRQDVRGWLPNEDTFIDGSPDSTNNGTNT